MVNKKLKQLPSETKFLVERIHTDKELAELGFECKGKLCEYSGYENFYERLWVWKKEKGNDVYIVIAQDTGNTNCNFAYCDMFIKELLIREEPIVFKIEGSVSNYCGGQIDVDTINEAFMEMIESRGWEFAGFTVEVEEDKDTNGK